MEVGTTNGTVTDFDGNFSLNIEDDANIRVSYIGYLEQDISTTDRTTLNIILQEDTRVLDELVVTGYGSQLKRTITGAISSVKGEDILAPNAVSADNLLQGMVAGLIIRQNSAQPGSGMSVNIRGALSPHGSNAPLYIIDGVMINSNSNKAAKLGPSNTRDFATRDASNRSPLATLNPNDIATIEVLKDASAAAIYGSSAANGVIIITTKKGQRGKPQVTYGGSFSVQRIGEYYEMLNAQDYMTQSNLAQKETWLYNNKYYPYGTTTPPSSGWNIRYDENDLAQTQTYNHFDSIVRTGMINTHNVSITAGSENFKIYGSFNYLNNKSIVKVSDLERFSGRVNIETVISKLVKLNVASMYTILQANNPSSGHWRQNANEAPQTGSALMFSPRLPLMDENDNLTTPEQPLSNNPLAWNYMKDLTTTKRLMFAPNLEVSITPELKANIQLSIDKTDEGRDIFSPKKSRVAQQTQENYGGFSNAYNNNYNLEEYLTYNKDIDNDHYLNAVIGSGYYITSGNSYSVTVFNFPTDVLENNYLQLSSDLGNTLYNSHRFSRNKLSFFGRLNYTFKQRYTLGATIRRDGSSVFAENNKWGWFPGISAGWNISEEEFVNNDVLSNLKLRGGIGTSGNESILTGNNYSISTYTSGTGTWYYFNGVFNRGIAQAQKGNKNLKWETDITTNIGLDFEFYRGRLSGSFDLYRRTAKDLLDWAALPVTDVVNSLAKNIGSTRSQGFEVDLHGMIIKNKDFNWSAYLNFSHNRSKWVERNPEVQINPWIKEQDDLWPIYGWKTNGIFQSPEEIQQYTSNGVVLQPNAYVGNKKYVDINGDGKMDENDIVRLGTNEPKLNFGLGTNLRYKNIMLDITTYGVLGQKTWDAWGYRSLPDLLNTSYKMYDVWTSYNNTGWWPGIAPNLTANSNPSGTDDFTLQNTNYIRFKDIKVTYIIPEQWLRSSKLAQNVSVYGDLQNSLILTNYKGLDPEMEQNASPLPIPLTLVFGIDITF